LFVQADKIDQTYVDQIVNNTLNHNSHDNSIDNSINNSVVNSVINPVHINNHNTTNDHSNTTVINYNFQGSATVNNINDGGPSKA